MLKSCFFLQFLVILSHLNHMELLDRHSSLTNLRTAGSNAPAILRSVVWMGHRLDNSSAEVQYLILFVHRIISDWRVSGSY